jgi:archaellum component FlaC
MTQDFTGTFDDIQEALEAQMRHKGDHIDKALTRLKALREAVGDGLQADVEKIQRLEKHMKDNRHYWGHEDDMWGGVYKAAALLASADRGK